MGLLESLFEWRDDRNKVAQLNYELQDLEEAFEKGAEREYQDKREFGYRSAYYDFRHEADTIQAAIDQLETKRSIRRAIRWRVPVPSRPANDEADDGYWQWSVPHQCFYLSDTGKTHLRREIALEAELLFRPVLSWGAVCISLLALIVSVLKP